MLSNRCLKWWLAFSLMQCSNSAFSGSNLIRINDAWISEAPPGVNILAAYATIENTGEQAITLKSVSSEAFELIEIHLSKTRDGLVSMEKQEVLEIPAQTSLFLSPGNYHLMLFQPGKAMRAGDEIEFEYHFSNGDRYNVIATVKKRGPVEHEHRH